MGVFRWKIKVLEFVLGLLGCLPGVILGLFGCHLGVVWGVFGGQLRFVGCGAKTSPNFEFRCGFTITRRFLPLRFP